MKKRLDHRPARTDLTSRECSKIIGALLGGLCQMSSVDTVRDAVDWWSETPEAWEVFSLLDQINQQEKP